MAEVVELRVRFDGEIPGLRDHTLSLGAFLPALEVLLKAVRRNADAIAKGSSDYEGRRRFGMLGKIIDLELVSISDGCVNLGFQCRLRQVEGLSEKTANDIATLAVDRFLAAVETESSGRNSGSENVKRFLRSIPTGVTIQEYEGRIGDRVIRRVSFGEPVSRELPKEGFPRLVEFRGHVISTTFKPHPKVKIRDASGVTFTCKADRAVVDKAVQFRWEPIFGQLLLRPDWRRLLTIHVEGDVPPAPSQESRLERIHRDWGDALRRLAE